MKYSIRHVLVLIFILLGLSGVFFVSSISYIFYQFNINHIINHHTITIKILADIIGGPFQTLQGALYPGTIESILRETLETPDIVFARVINTQNKTIEKSGDLEETEKIVENTPLFGQEVSVRDGIFNEKPIKEFSIKSRNGTNIWIGVILDSVKKHVLSIAIMVGEIITILFIIAVISIFLLVKKIIINPLMFLMDSFIKLENKEYVKIETSNYPKIKELQNVLRSFNLMSAKIKESEEKLTEDIKRMKELDRLKSEFISIAAHQLRTPLSAVKWTLKMAIDGDLGEMTPEQKSFLMQSYQSNERMIKLVNDFLNVVRIEEGRFEEGRFGYNFSPVQIEDLIDLVVRDFSKDIKEKKIKFRFKKSESPLPKTNIDAPKMNIVLQNIIDNAIKYTPEKKGVEISTKKDKISIEVAIKDSGVGIPNDQQDKVFSKFFRGNNVIKTQTQGTGLGLFIAKNIVEKHGGKIWFETKENKGTTFRFTIPIIEK